MEWSGVKVEVEVECGWCGMEWSEWEVEWSKSRSMSGSGMECSGVEWSEAEWSGVLRSGVE